ncbi:MAG: permease-like cell division protein FtsX [Candidatus Peribacteraceae bacterium]|jgi:cell division protein FtsX|nr:permease-like cell division protein FtsX [Candidatus Peribacteraceae bacterium]
MHLVVLRRSFRRALFTLWREGEWRTGFGSLLGICTLFQFLLLGLLAAAALQSLLLSHSDLKLEIRSGASRGEVQQFQSALQQLPYIERAVYITREQALARIKAEDPSLATFFEKFQVDNPFPDSIGVTLRSLNDYPAFSVFLSDARWQQLVDPALLLDLTHQEERVHELLRVANGGQHLAAMLLLLACGILLFTIVEFTRKSAMSRSAEVLVERLVGADSSLLMLPFIWEATLLLWGSVVMSACVLSLFLLLLPTLVPSLSNGGALAPLCSAALPILSFALPLSLILELCCAPLLAIAGVRLGIRPSLREASLGPR